MPVDNFKFSSPGVFINEIDESQLPVDNAKAGPVIIGRAVKGPAMRPVEVKDYRTFVQTFGEPSYGSENKSDQWREGNLVAPTYGAIAAQGFLANEGPITFVRLLGVESPNAEASGKAGWEVASKSESVVSANSIAYGIFAVPSSSAGGITTQTASLAAIVYTSGSALSLKGKIIGGSTVATSASMWVSPETAGLHKLVVSASSGTEVVDFKIKRGEKDDAKFIRKQLNIFATKVDPVTNSTRELYFLGETFEDALTSSEEYALAVVQLSGTLGHDFGKRKVAATNSETSWVFSQYKGENASFSVANTQKLFKIHSLTEGEWNQKNIKIAITNIKTSTSNLYQYGTFDLEVQDLFSGVAIEIFSSLSLDPQSPNYIAKKIGDKATTWDETNLRYTETGTYENQSKYIRVQMNEQVDSGVAAGDLLPFGFYLPRTLANVANLSASNGGGLYNADVQNKATSLGYITSSAGTYNVAFVGPQISTVATASAQAVWGLATTTGSSPVKIDKLESTIDVLRALPASIGSAYTANESQYITLDEVSSSATAGKYVYSAGSKIGGTSLSSGSVDGVLAYAKGFALPLVGGTDGFNVFKPEPICDAVIGNSTDDAANYALHTMNRAINSVADRETVPNCNLIATPGVSKNVVTDKVISVCQTRGDSLAVIDLEGLYVPLTEATSSLSLLPTQAISVLKGRNLDTSYATTYYPWIKVRNPKTNSVIFAPPSIAVLAGYAKSEKESQIWYAPAGFTRGRLDVAGLGIQIVDVQRKLTQSDRDSLYEAGINPIAKLPEGIVLFGQKTLQVTPSALDRVNVRRLMNYVKVETNKLANTTLFEPNVSETWKNFVDRADPFLKSLVTSFGISEYRLVLDQTTTTPDLIDRNIIYGKVIIKPVRVAEFIALDFTIVRSNVSLE